ncbi:hypothetical protein BX659_12731 [Orenia metallireducens]|uniref:Uncharacterized protein n=1 Tax=Orenia metallireducens TaxID=1413210 RepID=A0A285I3I2_9FIRM|nr:hypothetical protein [Orenia metallireducens]PRX23138.1 hypothetical protein BX659_12731 [Orenia metallireducens]SNY42562.1 hypothetical protein SAMN06265827_13031 [Orenia metallireducens]
MTKETDFFNNLKNKMKSNADKLKEEQSISKEKEEVEKEEIEEVAITKAENKVRNKNENKLNNTLKNNKDNKEKNNINNTNNNTVYNKDENTIEKNNSILTENSNNEEIRRTYYLRKSIVNEIDSFAKKTGNNKSYLVELALTYFLKQPDIGAKLVKEETSAIKFDPTKLVIPNQKDKEKVRRTYYLKKMMIEKLDKVAERTDQDKSFIVEEALKFLFANAEIK